MIVSTNTHNRGELTKSSKDFLVRLVPLAIKIQEWTKAKALFMNIKCPSGILASITISDIVIASQWGEHPISKPEFGNKYSNNLTLRQPDNNWKGKSHIYEGIKYCAFRDWRDYAINVSDNYVFSREFDHPLFCSSEEGQIKALGILRAQDNVGYRNYVRETTEIIDKYFLSEFNR